MFNIYFKIKTGKSTRGYDFTLEKMQSRFNVTTYSLSQRTININGWNKLLANSVHSSSINMFRKARMHLDSNMWTLDKPTASLSAAI